MPVTGDILPIQKVEVQDIEAPRSFPADERGVVKPLQPNLVKLAVLSGKILPIGKNLPGNTASDLTNTDMKFTSRAIELTNTVAELANTEAELNDNMTDFVNCITESTNRTAESTSAGTEIPNTVPESTNTATGFVYTAMEKASTDRD